MYAKFQVGPAPRQRVRGKTFVIYMFDEVPKSRGFHHFFSPRVFMRELYKVINHRHRASKLNLSTRQEGSDLIGP